MIVTEIISLDKKKSKVSIDGSFAFVLYRGELRRYGIREGAELAEEDYNEIINVVLLKRGKARAMYVLKDLDHTEKGLRDKLEKGFYPPAIIDAVIEYVKGYNYINDDRYGKQYIDTYGGRKSRRKLIYDLEQKGIPKEQIQEALEEAPVDELPQIYKLLKKKHFDPKTMDYKERQKIGAFLARKGYQYDNIQKAMGDFGCDE